MKYEYNFFDFKITETQETENWINRKAEYGFKVINIHYYNHLDEQHVRILMEKER
ncbi:hypothetical protein [Winogradskyella pacifica]|uniref:hypothetical protein n=1 Tax=Winogradskyella pacifica TaxID=664642 RepID=UPI0015C80503|nr:hypothetical protein [Winogradskyella pacifica]